MLDPRIYRMSLVVAALALAVLAFSLSDPPGAKRSTLAASAFNGPAVSQAIDRLTALAPSRPPGSTADRTVARIVGRDLGSRRDGFSVTGDDFSAQTPSGRRELRNVVATRPGTDAGRGAIVIVAPRDLRGSPRAAVSGTATLLELGRDLGGETLRRTVILASTSGSDGGAGIQRLAAQLPRPVDAVVVLGDLVSRVHRQPVVVPWTTASRVAPPALRSTIETALRGQASIRTSSPGVLGQLAHLAFPLSISPQAPLGAAGLPAVEISMSGERGPAADAATVGPDQLAATGRAVLSSISALDGARRVAPPSAYVLVDGKAVPSWAMSLFVLALIVPVLLTMIDGVARVRRRGFAIGRSLLAVLAAGAPFVAALVVVLVGRLAGLLAWTPEAASPGAVALDGGSIAVLAIALVVGCVVGAGSVIELRRAAGAEPTDTRGPRGGRGSRVARGTGAETRVALVERSGDGLAAATLLALCVLTLVIWVLNPLAAALLVPALHLWLWAIDSDLGLPVALRALLLAAGAVPTAGLVAYYGVSLGFGPGQLAWEAVLLVAGHVVSPVATVAWCLVLGCLVSGIALVLAALRRAEPLAAAVTVRGPVGYAGPGSLGGTKSALRR